MTAGTFRLQLADWLQPVSAPMLAAGAAAMFALGCGVGRGAK